MIQVEYRITPEDMISFQKHVVSQSRTHQLAWWFCLLFPLILIALFLVTLSGDELINVLIGFGVIYLVYSALYIVFMRLWMSFYIRRFVFEAEKRGEMGGDTRLSLSNETLEEVTERAKTEVKWKALHRIDETPSHMFVFINPLSAIIVPSSGFQAIDDYRRAVDFAKERFSHFHGNQ